jgi:hypothetical protein
MDLDCRLRRVMELIVTMERGKLVAKGEGASGVMLETACAGPSLIGDTSVKNVLAKFEGVWYGRKKISQSIGEIGNWQDELFAHLLMAIGTSAKRAKFFEMAVQSKWPFDATKWPFEPSTNAP